MKKKEAQSFIQTLPHQSFYVLMLKYRDIKKCEVESFNQGIEWSIFLADGENSTGFQHWLGPLN